MCGPRETCLHADPVFPEVSPRSRDASAALLRDADVPPRALLRLALVIILAIASAGFGSCAQMPTGSGYLGTYIDMKPNRYLEAESHLPWLTIDGETILVIQPVQPFFEKGAQPPFFNLLAESFQEALVREIQKTGLFAEVSAGHGAMTPAKADWVLRAVITEVDIGLSEGSLDPGNAVRGGRRVGIEGRVSNAESDRTLIKFKDIRVELLRSRGDTDVESGLISDLDDIARGIADTLREIRSDSLKVPDNDPKEAGGATPDL